MAKRYYIKRRYYGSAADFAEMEQEAPKKKKKGFLRRAGGLAMKGAAAYGTYKLAGKGLKQYAKTGKMGSKMITKARNMKNVGKRMAGEQIKKGYGAAKGAIGGMFKKKEGENK